MMVASHRRVTFGSVIQSRYSDKLAGLAMRTMLAAIFIQAFDFTTAVSFSVRAAPLRPVRPSS